MAIFCIKKRLRDRIISLRREVWAYKTSLTPPLFIEVPVPSQESERSCVCVLELAMLPLSTFSSFDLGIVPAVLYFLFFLLFHRKDEIHHFSYYMEIFYIKSERRNLHLS